ncbi:phosphoadenosine phosphosulfate reductase family protein [Methylophaga sp.]|uniref:phosphoadenosine phosphosulfate reductase domain-containing protein n=1 Tax=Methylophaga sp. TaxID=2024840 RepID=UPI003A8D66AD
MRVNVISMSGGKDSTAMALLALERETENLRFVFADTGHEQQQTLDYIDYLESALNITVVRVKRDFTREINVRRANLCKPSAKKVRYKRKKDKATGKIKKVRIRGWNNRGRVRALSVLYPTGNPFLDLCLWKGRFPSTKARFCSSELKHIPIGDYIVNELENNEVYSWQGVRAEESEDRAKLTEHEDVGGGLSIYRPVLNWTWQEVFAMHDKHGIKPNPLYKQGMGRVGCMPCIHCKKSELKQINYRFPEEIQRTSEMETLVRLASKRGAASFFAADKTAEGREKTKSGIITNIPLIHKVVEWSKTTRGGKMFDLFEHEEAEVACSSMYGLCE